MESKVSPGIPPLSDEEIAHTLNEALLEEASAIRADREILKDRIKKLEETKSGVSDAVYQRVRNDYITKQQQTTERLLSLKSDLETEEAHLIQKKNIVTVHIRKHQETIEESELRHSLGEYTDTEHTEIHTRETAEIQRLEEALNLLEEGLKRHQEIFEGEDFSKLMPLKKQEPVKMATHKKAPLTPPAYKATATANAPSHANPAPIENSSTGSIPKAQFAQAVKKMPDPVMEPLVEIEELAVEQNDADPIVIDDSMDDGDAINLADELEGLEKSPGLQSPPVDSTTRTNLEPENTPIDIKLRTTPPKPVAIPELHVLENGKVTQLVPVDKTVQIGRSPANDVILKEPKVSRKHAEIQFAAGKYVLLDLESSNGTFVSGKKVTEYTLQDGDEIIIGNTKMMFRATPAKK